MMCCFSICLVELIKMPLSQGAVLFCLEQRNLGGSVLKVSAAALQGCVDGKATFGRVRLVCGSQAPLSTASKQERRTAAKPLPVLWRVVASEPKEINRRHHLRPLKVIEPRPILQRKARKT